MIAQCIDNYNEKITFSTEERTQRQKKWLFLGSRQIRLCIGGEVFVYVIISERSADWI
jgi:hypothetical protein